MTSLTNQIQILRNVAVLRTNLIVDWFVEHKSVLALSGFAILNVLIYGFVLLPMASLLELSQTPRLNLYTLSERSYNGLWRVILAFLGLGLIYWQGWRVARNIQGKIAWAIVLGSALASGILLLFLYPFGAADVFDNVFRGRILGIYQSNPFVQTPLHFAKDPFFDYIVWKRSPSAYGPGWEVLAGLAARLAVSLAAHLGGDGVIVNVLAFKMLPGVFLLASLGLVALILRKQAPERALAGTLLLAWNPIVLYETWGNGHNDMAMVFWMLAAVFALINHRYTLAILALVAGALFKFIPLLLILPALAFAVRCLGHLPPWRIAKKLLVYSPRITPRARFLATTATLSILLVVYAYAPFWKGVKVLNITRRTQLYSSSLPASVYHILLDRHWDEEKAATILSLSALGLTGLFTILKSRGVWRKPEFDEFVESAVQILLFYLLVACLWFQNWYSLWPLGLVPLLRPGFSRRLVLLFGFAALSKPLGIGPLLFWPRPTLPQPWLEIWFTLGVFGLPWAYWLISTLKAFSLSRIKAPALSEVQA
jgi:hypothetical protein